MEYKMYIGGGFAEAGDKRVIGVINPADESVVREAPYGGRDDAARAVAAAAGAFVDWREKTAHQRARHLYKTAELIRSRVSDMARTLTMEVGKTLAESKGEILGAAAQFEWYAEEVKRRQGEWVPAGSADRRLITLRMPLGVAGAIAPWNFPVLLLARKAAPALAAGCTVVGRPASQTPLCTMELWNCIHEAGFPAGVANLVTGPPGEIADEFIKNPAVKKISFTGSVAVGKELMAKAAATMKKLSLELGGHAPFIVCDDVSVEEAAEKAVAGKFRNMGQVCISPTRFYVPERMKDEFAALAAKKAAALKIGNGLDPDTDVGPLHDRLRVAAMEALVQDIADKGGKILCGGKRPAGKKYEKGCWFEPTVATGVTREMLIMREEPFGPILPVIGYRDLDEAVREANDTPFGLAAYVLTHDLSRAFKLGEALEAGIIGVNDVSPAAAQVPFGGMKESGMGREGGAEGIDAYTEKKYLSIVV
ncbi:MAG TPA: NAD-dependent succinate-semialdehyde dehydrogenase [bacterium]|nr:NAD-dependent succinate-semialdehyde dehydrogenase [bacterium]